MEHANVGDDFSTTARYKQLLKYYYQNYELTVKFVSLICFLISFIGHFMTEDLDVNGQTETNVYCAADSR